MPDAPEPRAEATEPPSGMAPGRALPVAPVTIASRSCDPGTAAAEILAAIAPLDPALMLLFSSPSLPLQALARPLRLGLPATCLLAGCSTAGELHPEGYLRDSAVAIGFPAAGFRVDALLLGDLSNLDVSAWMRRIREMHARFRPDPRRHVLGLLLVDGLSNKEDVLIAALDAALPLVPVFGGSAGTGLGLRHGQILLGSEVVADAAVFCLIESELVVRHVVIDHFRSTGPDMVVTAARHDQRTIDEINAEPAAEEYARLVGVPRSELSPVIFAQHPLIVQINGRNFVRAIRSQTAEGSLVLMSAVETGTVMQLGRAEDMAGSFETALAALPGQPLLVLSFDCVLRRLAAERASLSDQIARTCRRFNVAGFNTYGEQHGGMHVNQTFVGLAFMPERSADVRPG